MSGMLSLPLTGPLCPAEGGGEAGKCFVAEPLCERQSLLCTFVSRDVLRSVTADDNIN